MLIGVISDTHGDVVATQRAIRVLDSFHVSLTIHCGDIGPEILPLLKGRRIHFVSGNMEVSEPLPDVERNPEHTFHDRLGTLELKGCRVAFLHGDDVKLLHHTIQSGQWDLLCHGHTHAFSSGFEGRTLVLNPGALGRTGQPSLAVVDLPSMEVTKIPL